ncbi:hypothetical protein GPECTOR_24g190 [Gonium pectorale]|uniref:Uncharacterized protein n=1 Tax=Gonium pectorale TaxID=33097 RepID=A0A150GGD4_GONPE|nr:hypothetical protein GPECTOR_24g190 [Gonium pectorale]|eukprot:KXZ48901.1 hypothetical protein GPECTOR_24g190 [Gonium pectorale]
MGQFIANDIERILPGRGNDAPIPVPRGDPFFDPRGTGNATLPFSRSAFNASSASGYRQPISTVTSFVDGSAVYGSDKAVSDALRAPSGGLLAVLVDPAFGPMLPTAVGVGLPPEYMTNDAARVPRGYLRAAGDVRANQHPPLLALHTLWGREHNRLAVELARVHPDWDDEALFQEARKWTVAYIQVGFI